jgi:metal-sulfur cluster biosynthetic enzyme
MINDINQEGFAMDSVQHKVLIERIMSALGEVYDPELGVNIVDLGLVYEVRYADRAAHVCMTLTTPGCPMHDMMTGGVRRALEGMPEIDSIEVEVVWEPRWNPGMMTDKAKDELSYM